jgi:hypothetical protein
MQIMWSIFLWIVQCYLQIELRVFSDPCSAGTYKANGMTSCQTCPAGKESNNDKTDCGKGVFYTATSKTK